MPGPIAMPVAGGHQESRSRPRVPAARSSTATCPHVDPPTCPRRRGPEVRQQQTVPQKQDVGPLGVCDDVEEAGEVACQRVRRGSVETEIASAVRIDRELQSRIDGQLHVGVWGVGGIVGPKSMSPNSRRNVTYSWSRGDRCVCAEAVYQHVHPVMGREAADRFGALLEG